MKMVTMRLVLLAQNAMISVVNVLALVIIVHNVLTPKTENQLPVVAVHKDTI